MFRISAPGGGSQKCSLTISIRASRNGDHQKCSWDSPRCSLTIVIWASQNGNSQKFDFCSRIRSSRMRNILACDGIALWLSESIFNALEIYSYYTDMLLESTRPRTLAIQKLSTMPLIAIKKLYIISLSLFRLKLSRRTFGNNG